MVHVGDGVVVGVDAGAGDEGQEVVGGGARGEREQEAVVLQDADEVRGGDGGGQGGHGEPDGVVVEGGGESGWVGKEEGSGLVRASMHVGGGRRVRREGGSTEGAPDARPYVRCGSGEGHGREGRMDESTICCGEIEAVIVEWKWIGCTSAFALARRELELQYDVVGQ